MNDLTLECISELEVGCKAYFASSESRPIEIIAFMSQSTRNNVPFSDALSSMRKLFDLNGKANFIEDRISPDLILHHGFHQGGGNFGATSQRRFVSEHQFAAAMAAKDIYIFGSHPHQVF